MYLNPAWRVLTVGDGDLSFSNAIMTHLKPALLVASTYDDEATINKKYTDNQLAKLRATGITVLTEFDVTNPISWQRLDEQKFDVVVFQFPLIPAFKGETEFRNNTQRSSMNVLNRALLHLYLKHAHQFALDKRGEMLIYITSKDVKPYREWNIEGSLNQGLAVSYLGQMPFDINQFPGYKVRNVDRDKHVKDTSGISYVFSSKATHNLQHTLTKPPYLSENYCVLCRVGPYMATEDKEKHLRSKKHQQMQQFEQDWQTWLSNQSN
ncbi:MAG: class I SAM-dependent methyltransferase [Pseudoalteromonas sp.]|uniref:class I SAM-dependent methyltransferase n=2 Tax=Pseudoalteromonas TaxID=53246 RepID=UPI003F9D3515